MFASGADSGNENSGIPGTVLIPTRFEWPYGGRRVSLCGSFTRLDMMNWSETFCNPMFYKFMIPV